MVKPVRRPDRATRARARDRHNRAQAAGRSEYRLDSRRLAILDAAEQLFLEKGFERAKLSEVIRRSGGSLATLYALFGNKEGLVGAVVQRRLELSLAQLVQVDSRLVSPSEQLLRLARGILDFSVSDIGRAMLRLLAAASLQDKAFGPRYHCVQRLPLIHHLEDIFHGWNLAGSARIDRPPDAARLFIAMALLDAPFETLLGVESPTASDEWLAWRIAPFLAWFRVA